MYVLMYRNRVSDNPAESWRIFPEGLYFSKPSALSDCKIMNSNATTFMYAVFELKEVK